MSTQGAVPTSHRARRRYFRYVTAGARRNVVASQRGLSAVLTNCDTRTRLTQREFVIASGHHSRSRTNHVSACFSDHQENSVLDRCPPGSQFSRGYIVSDSRTVSPWVGSSRWFDLRVEEPIPRAGPIR